MRRTSVREWASPRTWGEAFDALGRPGSVAIAGGTDLMVLLHTGEATPSALVDLTRIGDPSLRGVRPGASYEVGALTTMAELASSLTGIPGCEALREAAAQLGSPLIRNRATIGGNLCNASPAADTVPPLVAMGAEAVVASPSGERRIPVREFCTGVKRNALRAQEVVRCVAFPAPNPGTASAFHKIGHKRAVSLSVVSAAASVTVSGGRVLGASAAVGSAAPTPVVVPTDALIGLGTEEAASAIREVAARVPTLVSPITDVRGSEHYRREMSAVLTERALAGALARAVALGGDT